MARKRKEFPILENVTITDVAAEGKALARVNDMVVFVPFVVPGDVVDLKIRKKKHSYCEAEVVRFVKYSETRAEPVCQHFGVCGGCKWQNLPYEEQLRAKQQQVFDQLSRISHVQLPEFNPIMGSQLTLHYRNKLEFGCSNKRWLTREQVASGETFDTMNAIGFHITGAFDKILPIEKCWLMDDLQNRIRNEIRDYALANGITFFDLRQQVGLLRDVMIRNSDTGEWMVLVQFHFESEGDQQTAEALLSHLGEQFPQITSLLWVDNQKCNDTFGDLPVQVFKGNDHIFEVMEDLKFKVGPKSFYQTNTLQAYHLYDVARQFANLNGNEIVYDLYTGTGTIANFVARKAKKVVGVEYVPEAIEDAKVNSELNGIDNTTFYAGDMKDILNDEFIAENGQPDVIITDPPRAGMHADVIETQARDLIALDNNYEVKAVQPVDMFPHTPHVENVVLLERRY